MQEAIDLFNVTSFKCSRIVTQHYSTSFTLGIKTLDKKFHFPIYAIYGFVRYADEIVDTFHDYDKEALLKRFKEDTYHALRTQISLNPILQSFQMVVNQYKIDHNLIEAFLKSMEMDLHNETHCPDTYQEYIYGSAEVVGLMCLQVFCEGNMVKYKELEPAARKLGAAFQKVNFLRDMKSDYLDRGRVYFPGIAFDKFTPETKVDIESDIKQDFDDAFEGIKRLPKGAKLGVYLSYIYYLNLFKKIKTSSANTVLNERIRISDYQKFLILLQTYFKHRFNYL